MKRIKVPYFSYDRMAESDRLLELVNEVARRGGFIMQRELSDFETELGSFIGKDEPGSVIGVADGTIAIQLALELAGIGPGDEVLVPTHTFIATAAAIVHVGAEPILVDIGDDLLMSSSDAAIKITNRTKAILPVQLNGFVCDMDAICSLASAHNLLVIEDSAQALGAQWKGRMAGTFGFAGTASFFPAKTLGCYGDGGALFVNGSCHHSEAAFLLRNHGRDSSGMPVRWGYNCRLDNLQAAVLNKKLREYPTYVQRRVEIANRYNEAFKNIDGLQVPGDYLDPRVTPVYQNYEIIVERRVELERWLKALEIGTLRQWSGYMLHQCRELKIRGSDSCPNAEKLCDKTLMLPLNHYLTDEEVDAVTTGVLSFYEK